jgi:hypothetical protein
MKSVADAVGRALLALLLWPLQAWAARHYRATQAGTLRGILTVAWYRPDLFVYTPDARAPLVFTRHDGQRIEPARMFTDGGSIPRPLWFLRNYSPWGFGPAFVIHDWLFHMRACNLPGYEAYSLQSAARVLSEVMKTLLQLPGFDYGSRTTMFLMYLAVQSAPARKAWDFGRCIEPPAASAERSPDALIRINFP